MEQTSLIFSQMFHKRKIIQLRPQENAGDVSHTCILNEYLCHNLVQSKLSSHLCA